MGNIDVNELASDARRSFQAALGPDFEAVSSDLFLTESFRGGFRLVFARPSIKVIVLYSDAQLEVECNGRELFGNTVHADFEGNMFSREHLKQFLPRISASAAGQLRAAG